LEMRSKMKNFMVTEVPPGLDCGAVSIDMEATLFASPTVHA